MIKVGRSIAFGMLLAVGLVGCSGGEGTPSVPSSSGNDSAAKKPDNAPPAEKRGKASGPATALD